jgi:hypothetical protein
MSGRKFFLGISILIFISIIGWFVFFFGTKQSGSKENAAVNTENIQQKIFLTIDNGATLENFETNFGVGITAFDLLKKKSEENNIILQTQNSSSGIFINAIGDKKNGEGGLYWLYYVNGEMPMVSADKNLLKPGDKVEFKFEKSPF